MIRKHIFKTFLSEPGLGIQVSQFNTKDPIQLLIY